MDALCGSKFWDANRSVHTDDPDLTPCFQNSLLAWVPCIYLGAALPCYLFHLRHHHRGYVILSPLSRLKTALGVLLWCISWADLFYAFHDLVHGWAPAPIFFITPLLVGVTVRLATLLIRHEWLQGVQSPGVLIIFWFPCVVCAVVPFRSKILSAVAKGKTSDPFRFATFYIYFALVLFALILSRFREQPPFFSPKNADPNPSPEVSAGFFSRRSFWWFTKMAILGYRRPLEEQDLWSLTEEDRSQVVVDRLMEAWKKQQKQAARHRAAVASGKSVSGEDVVLLGGRPRPREPSFPRAVLATCGSGIFKSICFRSTQDLLSFVNPQPLSILIRFISNPVASTWWGFPVAGLMFACSVTLLSQQYLHCIYVMVLRLRSAITGVIYRKVRWNRVPRGLGVSLTLLGWPAVVAFLCLCPSVGVCAHSLGICLIDPPMPPQNLGPSILAGVALIVLLVPLNGAVALKMRALQVGQMKFKCTKLMSEIPGGFKVLKLYAWEPVFLGKVEGLREDELRMLRQSAYLQAISTFTWVCTPFLVTLITLGVYVSVDQNNVPDAEKAFVSVSLFNILKTPRNLLPQIISGLVQISLSLKRIQHFLSQDELDPHCVERKTITPGERLGKEIPIPTSAWVPGLLALSLDIQGPKGALAAVVGPVGCGKSSLVSVLLGEMEKLEGPVCVKGSVAYVPQQAWIQNCTLQENILFGRALDPKRYQQALEACALLADLEMLPAGDQTEIGEKGIHLSGGQRQRVSLARAVYREADLFMLDDPLSAVDSHVAKHLFDQVIGPEGVLAGKTRVLVTHSINFLPQMDFIIVLADGQVSEAGPYPALLQHSGSFANFLCNYAPDKPEKNLKEGSRTGPQQSRGSRESSVLDRHGLQVKLSVFWDYANEGMGLYTIVAICLLYLGHSVAAIGASVWLSAWSDEAMVDGRQNNTSVRLGVYAALSVLQGLLVMVSAITLMVGSVQAARSLQRVLLHKMRWPQSFFHTTPSGRILNRRLSKDIYVIDEVLAPTILLPLNSFHNSISAFVVIIASTPLFTVVTLPLAVLYIAGQRFYVATSRHLKRLDSVSRSPIYSHFSETVTGTSVIRAYGRSQDFKAISDAKVDTNMRSSYPYVASNRWLWVHVESVGNCVVFFAALSAVIGRNSPSPGLVGLSVSYALQITISLTWMIQMMSDLESNIVAVERVKEYSKIETEAPWVVEGGRPPAGWSLRGEVEFWNFSVRYQPGLELVLSYLSLRVHTGEKAGIVGRTGAGKSSTTLCPFRILEAAEGEIRIDGLNVADMGLHDLRPQLTVIPQDPILFSASLRMNLDPFGYYSEADLWRALELSHLHTFVGSQPEGLDFQCSGVEDFVSNDTEPDHFFSLARVLVLDRGTVAEFDSPANLIAARGIFYGMARDAGLV
ncbi:LOW QUALITY PROTEIN: ATP-binding cassette sub-family C member 3 [Herpailurus yagouaroundi]|uniref:LOW QUALITY PROTEIN: ATP-binding cassette sub-family C member 3 n=1 Tax=Herpailurus yagouaroundi TaxID=1608482 RepID=UPI001AD73D62|nr:LOW QUALITY PROTEIN: ATP-binding cassette sub-family C member 3 [Puma yagouaroundi]